MKGTRWAGGVDVVWLYTHILSLTPLVSARRQQRKEKTVSYNFCISKFWQKQIEAFKAENSLRKHAADEANKVASELFFVRLKKLKIVPPASFRLKLSNKKQAKELWWEHHLK